MTTPTTHAYADLGAHALGALEAFAESATDETASVAALLLVRNLMREAERLGLVGVTA